MAISDTVERDVFLTKKQFDELDEYSCSIPTGTTIGKRWKRSNSYSDPKGELKWWMGEYVKQKIPFVGIVWKRIFVREVL